MTPSRERTPRTEVEGDAPRALPAGDRAMEPATHHLERHDDRYVIDQELASGGMGRVYAGRDLRLGRPVAIKVLLDPEAALQRRFEREALVAARLQHPGIVTVYDAGFWPTGEPYLVMRRVLGRSLDRVIADTDSPADRLALLPHLITAVDALAYAHDQGVVHRDLKPSNVIVGAFGETVVVDWGLAKVLGSDDDPPSMRPASAGDLTQDGAVLGTPGYMPPEQAAGRSVDARADVYALGALLYHALAGAAPGGGAEAGRWSAPPPLPAVVPAVPTDLAAVVAKAMAADPDGRYPSAFELADDLKRFQTGQLVAARRYSALQRLGRWSMQRGVLVAALAVAAGLAVGQC